MGSRVFKRQPKLKFHYESVEEDHQQKKISDSCSHRLKLKISEQEVHRKPKEISTVKLPLREGYEPKSMTKKSERRGRRRIVDRIPQTVLILEQSSVQPPAGMEDWTTFRYASPQLSGSP